MSIAKVIKFAKEQGYASAVYLNEWNGYSTYEPLFEGKDVTYTGPPLIILVKGDTIRMSTVEEAFKQMDAS